ncbi:hypothetical protein HB777_11865 [Mesorhizobium loti]|nr:hypothetical protein HB777_11865 [Mesorhizobium loti]
MTVLPYEQRNESSLPSTYLAGVANVDTMLDQHGEVYRYMRRRADPIGLLLHDQIALKIYHLRREGVDLQPGTAENLEAFLTQQIESGDIDLKQRVGFAILGQGFVTITIFGKGNAAFNYAYSVEDNYPALSRISLERAAIACTWDSKIIYYELRRWHEYITSTMNEEAKRRYLTSFISGWLDAADCPV